MDNQVPLVLAVEDLAYSGGEIFELLGSSVKKADLELQTVPIADAVETARDLRPALIIVGHRPLLDDADMRRRWEEAGSPMGGDIIEALKSNPDTKEIPVLLLEALSHIELAAQTYGADAYLQIPVDPKEFIDTIRKLVGKNGRKVLVIHKDQEWGDLFNLVLAKCNDQVRFVSDGHQALATAVEDPPDLIFVYWWTPWLDPFEFCEQLKTKSVLQHIPVVFFGALHPRRAHPMIRHLGIAGYLSLPFDPKELIEARNTVLGGDVYFPIPSIPPLIKLNWKKVLVGLGTAILGLIFLERRRGKPDSPDSN